MAQAKKSKKLSKVDLLMHPVRMRILVTLAGQHLTAQQIMERLPDISQATLYRHLALLAQQQVLEVVEERPMRGTLEKVYALNGKAALLSPEDMAGASPDEHLRFFLIFLVSLLDDFERYVASEPSDFVGDGFGYRALPLFLTDDEFKKVVGEINTILRPYLDNGPSAERRRRLLATISIPDALKKEDSPHD